MKGAGWIGAAVAIVGVAAAAWFVVGPGVGTRDGAVEVGAIESMAVPEASREDTAPETSELDSQATSEGDSELRNRSDPSARGEGLAYQISARRARKLDEEVLERVGYTPEEISEIHSDFRAYAMSLRAANET